ncbi:MAG: hypothetical protein V4675_24790 [Verrucomicrobiota bacterium]
MNHLNALIPIVILASALIFNIVNAQEEGALKTEYYEAAVNSAKAVNYKRWNTSRDGKVILTHEERDLMRNGKFSQIDSIVFYDGKKLLHFFTLEGKRTCSYHPETGCTVTQGDPDGDGRYDAITVSDPKGVVVDYFDVAADGKLTPISDAKLKVMQKALKDLSEQMKNFDK